MWWYFTRDSVTFLETHQDTWRKTKGIEVLELQHLVITQISHYSFIAMPNISLLASWRKNWYLKHQDTKTDWEIFGNLLTARFACRSHPLVPGNLVGLLGKVISREQYETGVLMDSFLITAPLDAPLVWSIRKKKYQLIRNNSVMTCG